MKNVIFSLFLLIGFCSCSAKGTKNTSILVDLTTYEKNPKEVERELIELRDELIKEMQGDEGKKYLGSSISLSFINERGENSPEWNVKIAKDYGKYHNDFKRSVYSLKNNINGTIEKLKKEKGSYQQSWIVEPIVKELKRMKDEDKLYVISDLLVVDGENNFEKFKFGRPQDLSRYGAQKKLELRRISLGGLKVREIALLEAWWESSKSGDNTDYLAELSRFQKRTLGAPRVAYQKVERTSMPLDEDPRQ